MLKFSLKKNDSKNVKLLFLYIHTQHTLVGRAMGTIILPNLPRLRPSHLLMLNYLQQNTPTVLAFGIRKKAYICILHRAKNAFNLVYSSF